jgi:hypothetical protein
MAMRLRVRCLALVVLLAAGAAYGQYQPAPHADFAPPRYASPGCQCCPPGGPVMPGVPAPPGVPPMPGADQTAPPRVDMTQPPQLPQQPTLSSDALAQAGGRGTLGDTGGTPPIFGDLIGIQGSRVVVLAPGATLPPQQARTFRVVNGNRIIVAAPVPYRGAYKITENESPRPTTRLYFNYNFFNNVDNVDLFVGGTGHNADLHRETVGFEYAFADGDASVGLRMPFFQLAGNSAIEDSEVGDLTAVFKYAFLNDRQTGNLLSGGLVLTMPTAKGVNFDGESTIHPWVFQPFLGGIYNVTPDLYLTGFSSVVIPTDARDVTIWFNSLALGYWLYRDADPDARLRGVIPVVETHVSTPFNHRGTDHADPLFYQDTVNLTGGAHFLFNRADLGVAVGVPVTGVRPYDLEVNVLLNIRF